MQFNENPAWPGMSSVATLPINKPADRLVVLKLQDSLRNKGNRLCRAGYGSHMRRYCYAWVRPQRMSRGQWLLIKHIQHCSLQFARIQRLQQILLDQMNATRQFMT